MTAAIDEECVGGVKPALGLAWAEQVTVRLMMTRSEGVGDETELQQVSEREKGTVLQQLLQKLSFTNLPDFILFESMRLKYA